jgi:hypothetical protein
MIGTNIHRINSLMQDRHEGKFTMQGLAFTRLIHNVIREYGTYGDNSYTVYMSDIGTTDRRLLLSHVLDPDEYEETCESVTRIDAAWNEKKKYLQSMIQHECGEVWRDDMEEMRDHA